MNSKKTTKAMKYGAWAGLLLCASMTAYAQNPVTFRVDLGVKIAQGQFDPSTQTVEVRGTAMGWGPGLALTNNMSNTNIYENTYDYTSGVGSSHQYKFWYGNPGDNWEPFDGNRSFTLEAGGQTLPTVFFGNDSVVNPTLKAAVLFQVDMSVQVTAGNFDKSTHEVWARGSALGWGDPPGQGFQLFEDTSRPCVYTNTYTKDNQFAGDEFAYKYTIWKPGVTWEDKIDNRVLVWDGTEATNEGGYHLKIVGPVFFNTPSDVDVLSQDTTVTFRVDMNSAQRHPGGELFDANTEGVWVNGSFKGWGWDVMEAEYQMFDDQTHGDETAGDKIYSWQRTFLLGQSVKLEYKYGIQSSDNEAGFGTNHVRFIRALGTYVMPIDTFGVMLQEPAAGSLAISGVSGGNVTLTWNGRPNVLLQCATNLTNPAWQDVANTDGQSLKVVPAGGGSKFFRLVTP